MGFNRCKTTQHVDPHLIWGIKRPKAVGRKIPVPATAVAWILHRLKASLVAATAIGNRFPNAGPSFRDFLSGK